LSDAGTGKLWWAVPAGAILLLLALAVLLGREPERLGHGTSYDASRRGFRAAYLLLEELGYPVRRTRRAAVGEVRWVFFPREGLKEAKALDHWVREGGSLLFADASAGFAQQMGIPLACRRDEEVPAEEPASGLTVRNIAGGATRVDWPGKSGEALVSGRDGPVVTRFARGRGEIWLVHRPEVVTNRLVRKADNAVLVCRLAEAMLDRRNGTIDFDEYLHGMRDRPGVVELLFRPPVLWFSLHALAFLGIALWHFAPRFGPQVPVAGRSRRSREEFLQALASLLDGKGDYAAAFESVRSDFERDLSDELGLPSGTPTDKILIELGRRRPLDREMYDRALGQLPPRPGPRVFIKALNDLETARDEFSNRRRHRQPFSGSPG
jgi:hypothetical protein